MPASRQPDRPEPWLRRALPHPLMAAALLLASPMAHGDVFDACAAVQESVWNRGSANPTQAGILAKCRAKGILPAASTSALAKTSTSASPARAPRPSALAHSGPASASPSHYASVRINSGFGNRVHPVIGKIRHHNGIDLDLDAGATVSAMAPGQVIYAGWMRGYGRIVVVQHGPYQTWYAHLDTVRVRKGQAVRAHTQLGTVGSTGMVTGPHLHLEVRRGKLLHKAKPVDPRPFLSNPSRLGSGAPEVR